MSSAKKSSILFDMPILKQAVLDALVKFSPKYAFSNLVMGSVWLGFIVLLGQQVFQWSQGTWNGFDFQILVWLFFTVFFSNLAEAFAEGRGKARAESLRKNRVETMAKVVSKVGESQFDLVPSEKLQPNQIVFVEAGDYIPADGEVIQGIASVDESAITGESAPVIRESGGDRSAVTGGTKVISDFFYVKITTRPGENFLDKMIGLIEGAKRQKTPNEIALGILLTALSLLFFVSIITFIPMANFVGEQIGEDWSKPFSIWLSLYVCLIPTTISALLSAIGISGMERLIKHNVMSKSGKAIEAAGDINVLLLDKTGTITLGNREAHSFLPMPGVTEEELANAGQLASLSDETPEGRSIVVLAKQKFRIRARSWNEWNMQWVPFSASTRMSGIDIKEDNGSVRSIRKGAMDAIKQYIKEKGGSVPTTLLDLADNIAKKGSTPILVAEGSKPLGVIELKDTIKGGLKEKFTELRAMGIKTIMITGDNPLTAAAIAAEAGVDDFIAEATPKAKLDRIRMEQEKGCLVAMIGDGTNDAPALAQSDVGVAMNTGTQTAREAGNMIDLDSNPSKLIEIVEIGKQLLMTRGALTTFSLSNDVAKYFAIIPAIFSLLAPLNIMKLSSPENAILSAVIFNALIIPALIPIALSGIKYKAEAADITLLKNLIVFGLGGLLLPFIGIKGIDLILGAI